MGRDAKLELLHKKVALHQQFKYSSLLKMLLFPDIFRPISRDFFDRLKNKTIDYILKITHSPIPYMNYFS